MLIRKSKTNQVINSEWTLEFLAPTNNLRHVAQIGPQFKSNLESN